MKKLLIIALLCVGCKSDFETIVEEHARITDSVNRYADSSRDLQHAQIIWIIKHKGKRSDSIETAQQDAWDKYNWYCGYRYRILK